jgi:hypothetical protein
MSGSSFRWPPFAAALPPLIAVVAVALVVGCQVVTPGSSTSASPSRIVEFDAADYTFNAPETMSPGLTTIRFSNLGTEPHHGQLLRLNDGVTFEQFTAALQQEGEAALRLTSGEGGPGTTDPRGITEVTLDLKPGSYVLACFIAGADGVPHLMKGMLKPIQVTGPAEPAVAPSVQGTFTMKDFAFDIPARLPAGKATYKVVNLGPQMHELNVVKLAAGKTAEDVVAWLSAPAGPPPFEDVGGINAFSADGSGYMTLNLQPGAYAAICNVPDPGSGVPHSHLGMLKQFTVETS